jgi:hypothetical protein
MPFRPLLGKKDCHLPGSPLRSVKQRTSGKIMALSIGKAWDEARAALAANRRLLTPVALGLILVPAVISSMVEPQTAPGVQPEAGAWMWIALAMIIVMLAGQMAVVLLTTGWTGSVGEAIGRAFRRLPTLILSAIVIMLPLILAFSAALAFAGFTPGMEMTAENISGTGLAVVLLLLLVVLVIGVRLLPLVVVIAREQAGPIAAIRRSFALTSGHFWKLFLFVLLATVAFIIVAAAAGAVVGSIVVLALGTPEPWSVALLLIALAAGLVQAAFVTIYTAMLGQITEQLGAGQVHVPDVDRAG